MDMTKEQTPLEAAKEWMERTGCLGQNFKNAFSGPSAIIEALIGELERMRADNTQLRLDQGVPIPKSVKYRHMEEEIERLKQDLGGARLTCSQQQDRAIMAESALSAANARAERLREALEVYADENEWRGAGDREVWDLLFNSSKIDGDGWETARRALADDAKEGV